MTSISAERSGLAKVGMTLRRREQWGARRSYTDARSVTEPATKQFIHITVTNPNAYRSHDAHTRAIEAIGIARFSNTGISYNRLFMAGTRNVYEAQPIGRRGAHTVNDFRRSSCSTSGCPSRGTSLTAPSWNLNVNARAYAYASNVGFSVPDHVVDDLARSMAADRLAGFVTRTASVHGHRCVSAKSCPGDRMWERMGDLERRVEHYLSNGLDGEDDMTPQELLAHRVELSDAQKRWFGTGVDTMAVGALLGYAGAGAWEAREDREKQDAKLDALLAAQEGLDTSAVLARIDERHAEAAQQRQTIAETMTERLDSIAAVVSEHADGTLDAKQVVQRIGELLITDA